MSLIDLLQQQYENPVSESETLSPEEIETYTKVASAFCEQNDIDFDTLSEEGHGQLFEHLSSQGLLKSASDEEEKEKGEKKEEKKDEDEKELEEKAKAEFAKEKQASDAMATAEALGRQMAHSFDQELQKIASEREASARKEASARQAPTGIKLASAQSVSPIDIQAGRHAVKLAADAGYDSAEAAERVGAVLTIGSPQTKVASAATYEDRVHGRAIELLTAAGYPVQ